MSKGPMYKNYDIRKCLYKNQINNCYIQFTIFKWLHCIQLDTIIDYTYTNIYIIYIYIYMCVYLYIYIHIYMKTIFPPRYHHNGFVINHALGLDTWCMVLCAQVHELPQRHCGNDWRTHCFYNYIYIVLILLQWDLSTLWVMHHLWPLKYVTTNVLLYILWHLKKNTQS